MNDTTGRAKGAIAAHEAGEHAPCISRADALAERVLVEVPPALGKECGFRLPVALSNAAWETCVEWADAGNDDVLFDVLFAALDAIRRKTQRTDHADFVVQRVATGEDTPAAVALRAVVGPGDAREPVLTIWLADEA